MATLAACATTEEAPPAPAASTAAAAAAPTPPVVLPGPPAAVFIGRSVADLEAVLGPPDFIRKEGPNEFRRYDLTEDCRALAVVEPAGGNVTALTAGPAIRGADAPDFEECTATAVTVGG